MISEHKHVIHDNLSQRIQSVDWSGKTQQLHEQGYVVVSGLLSSADCAEAIGWYADDARFRKTVNMARYRFGMGEYRYFSYPLPASLQVLRSTLYPHLATVANDWNRELKSAVTFPTSHDELLDRCRAAGQRLPTALILKYGPGGYNTLHQDLYGDVYFPMQAVFLLSEPDADFTGGEFVLIEQLPRAQSRAIVVKLNKGDALIFTTRFRPVKGTKGYYRVNVKHGVSEIHQGNRYAMGIIFHDATS